MVRAAGHLHNEEFSGDRILMIIGAFIMSAALILPLWGLAVIMFEFILVFLPVLLIVGFIIEIYRTFS